MSKKTKKPLPETPLDKADKVIEKGKEIAGGILKKFKKYLAPEKVDAFQKDWLSNPKNRKKYESIKDVPEIVVEEAKAMTDDMIQFLQKQEGGKSVIFKKIKNRTTEFLENPAEFVKEKAKESEKIAKKTVKAVKKDSAKKPTKPSANKASDKPIKKNK